MFELIGTALTGGITGVVGSVIGKAFSFLDAWQEEKKATNEHGRTIALLELQNKIGAEESEREITIAQSKVDADSRMASYSHDSMAGTGSLWVIDLLRLVRPVLTFSLIVLVGMLYFSSDTGGRTTIEASVIYLCSSSCLWWFGDRALRKKT
jgi:hypothetical protein